MDYAEDANERGNHEGGHICTTATENISHVMEVLDLNNLTWLQYFDNWPFVKQSAMLVMLTCNVMYKPQFQKKVKHYVKYK